MIQTTIAYFVIVQHIFCKTWGSHGGTVKPYSLVDVYWHLGRRCCLQLQDRILHVFTPKILISNNLVNFLSFSSFISFSFLALNRPFSPIYTSLFPTSVASYCHVLLAWLIKGFGLDNWIYWSLLYTRNHNKLQIFIPFSLWLYSPLDFGPFFSSLILYTVGKTPWTGDQPVVRPLPTHRTTHSTQTYMPLVGFEPKIPVF
jgi:hypothetical protein